MLLRQVEHGLDIILGNLFLVVSEEHLLILMYDRREVHRYYASATVFQHLLHSLESTGGVLTVFTDLLEVASEHVEHINGIFVVVFAHVFLLILDIGLHVFYQTFRELGEVIDVVQWVEDSVDESLGEFTCCSHLLQSHYLRSTFLDEILQTYLLLLQSPQTQTEEPVGQEYHQEEVEDYHVPPVIEWRVDLEPYACRLRHFVCDVESLDAEGVVAVGEVGEAGRCA